MSRTLKVYVAVALGWAVIAGALLSVTGIALDSLAGAALIGVLYMPSPMVAALIAERGLRRERLGLPRRGVRPFLPYVLVPVGAVVAFVLLFLGAVFVGGDLLGLDAIGRLALTQDQLMAGAASLVGQETVAAAGPPPPVAVLLVATLWGALVAGWTLNGVLAMGEEYGWRGLMWDELRHQGPVRANLITGVVWGLWHAPLIVQGYNYPGFPFLGIAAMAAFCVGMSFALTAVRQLTGSLIPVAAAHGMLNGIAPLLLILAPDTHPTLAGPLGLLGGALFAVVGAAAWAAARRRAPAQPIGPVATVPELAAWAGLPRSHASPGPSHRRRRPRTTGRDARTSDVLGVAAAAL